MASSPLSVNFCPFFKEGGRYTIGNVHYVREGGTTSGGVAVKAMKIRKAYAMGQISAGVPVWEAGPESLFPGLPYVVFPGNVGEAGTLREVTEELLR